MNKIALIAGVVSLVVVAGGYTLWKKTETAPVAAVVNQQAVQKVPAINLPEPPPPPPEAVQKAKSFNDQLQEQMMKRTQELRAQREAAEKAGTVTPPATKP